MQPLIKCPRLDTPTEQTGYLHHGHGTQGPFLCESVRVRHLFADNYEARFEGRWRKVHIQVNRTFILYRGECITIQIEGV